MQALQTSLPVLSPRLGGNIPGVDLMASLPDIQLFIINTLLASDATRGGIREAFRNSAQAKIAGGNIFSPECLSTTLSMFLTMVRLI